MGYRTLLAEIGMPGRGLFSLDFSSLTVGKVESGVCGRSTPKTTKVSRRNLNKKILHHFVVPLL